VKISPITQSRCLGCDSICLSDDNCDITQQGKTLDNSVQLWVIRTILSNYLDNSATYDVSARYGRCDISVLTSVVGYQN